MSESIIVLSLHNAQNNALTLHSVEVVESDEIPASSLELATQKRQELIEQLAEVDDEIAELFLNDALPSNAQLAVAIRRATVSLKFSPVFLGSGDKEYSNTTPTRWCLCVPRRSGRT